MTEGDDVSWMPLGFAEEATPYQGPTQRAKYWTEGWAGQFLYCPSCGADHLRRFGANRPVADLFCETCGEQYELKAQKGRLGNKLNDGAYATMQRRLAEDSNPNLFAMRYSFDDRAVTT